MYLKSWVMQLNNKLSYITKVRRDLQKNQGIEK